MAHRQDTDWSDQSEWRFTENSSAIADGQPVEVERQQSRRNLPHDANAIAPQVYGVSKSGVCDPAS